MAPPRVGGKLPYWAAWSGRIGVQVRTVLIAAMLAGAAAGAVAAILIALLLIDTPQTDPATIERVVRSVLETDGATARDEEEAVIEAVIERIEAPTDQRVVTAYARVAPSIVLIDAEGAELTSDDGVVYRPAALGTGIVLDDDGNIVTAAHVLEGMERINVVLPGGDRRVATLISSDAPFSDVAVIQVDSTGLLPAPFGTARTLNTGETVLAVGNILLGQEIAMTLGIVSQPDTEFSRDRYIQRHLIQTDAALNHGNSGGALVNLDGEVVGLTTVIARATREGDFVDGVGFAIRIDPVLEVARAIAANGYYPRPTFGVVDERLLTPIAAAQLGLSVTTGAFLLEIKRSGVFARAGIRPGDVVLEIGGMTIDAETPYVNALAMLRPGVPVNVLVHRDGEPFSLVLTPELRLP